VTLVTAELGQELGLTDAAAPIEDKELSLIRGIAFFQKSQLFQTVDEHPPPTRMHVPFRKS
jgi:hypothetical protein